MNAESLSSFIVKSIGKVVPEKLGTSCITVFLIILSLHAWNNENSPVVLWRAPCKSHVLKKMFAGRT
ncbi:hypothetical protein WN51_14271 [Melipona quadrifasciata]|uniref:Uncharacterized protein n=1 Tax=Melipona quadrifasciata TaxID=166423 RepID=A0A0M9A3N0_9HYME|nr:hypothetical protein WN51_14271 [Melipona quadrifasciata]